MAQSSAKVCCEKEGGPEEEEVDKGVVGEESGGEPKEDVYIYLPVWYDRLTEGCSNCSVAALIVWRSLSRPAVVLQVDSVDVQPQLSAALTSGDVGTLCDIQIRD